MIEIGLKINGQDYGWMKAHSWDAVHQLIKQVTETIESEERIAAIKEQDFWRPNIK